MKDPHEKTHGGFGPTYKEWDDEIVPRLQSEAEVAAKKVLQHMDEVSGTYKNAGKVLPYTAKTHVFMRTAVQTLFAFLYDEIYQENESAKYRALRLEALEERVRALDGIAVTKSLDMEAYDAMGDIASRLERIEGELQEQVSGKIQYRGYWRSGEIAQEGDCFSHNGSTYRANCLTETEPGTAGGD